MWTWKMFYYLGRRWQKNVLSLLFVFENSNSISLWWQNPFCPDFIIFVVWIMVVHKRYDVSRFGILFSVETHFLHFPSISYFYWSHPRSKTSLIRTVSAPLPIMILVQLSSKIRSSKYLRSLKNSSPPKFFRSLKSFCLQNI